MPEISLTAQAGRPAGSRHARRLRAAGQVPGVVYGHGITPLPVAVDARALRAALTSPAGSNALLAIQVDGTTHLTMAKELQRHPVRGTVTHVDFLVVRRDEVVGAEVPITLVGEADRVHRGDGVVDQQMFALAVRALPALIPDSIEVDLATLAIGQTVRVGDLALPQGVEAEADPEQAVVVGQARQVSEADLGGAEGAEAGEETAGAPAGAGSSGSAEAASGTGQRASGGRE